MLQVSYSETPKTVAATWQERHGDLPGRPDRLSEGDGTGSGSGGRPGGRGDRRPDGPDRAGAGLPDGFEVGEGNRL